MTECERLLAEGKFDEAFFEPEERAGWQVSREQKKVWAIELDLFDRLTAVCRKYGLRYYADGGTLLGAVRHGGFIPWDHDMDFVMPRADFEKLCAVAEEEFVYPYVLHKELSECGCPGGVAKLENLRTSAEVRREPFFRTRTMRRGIWLDVFVMDLYSEDEAFEARRYRRLRRCLSTSWIFIGNTECPNRLQRLFRRALFRIFGNAGARFFSRLGKALATRRPPKPDRITSLVYYTGTRGPGNVRSWPLAVYGEPRFVPFENRLIPIPQDPHANLAAIFGGDYMTPRRFDSEDDYTLYPDIPLA